MWADMTVSNNKAVVLSTTISFTVGQRGATLNQFNTRTSHDRFFKVEAEIQLISKSVKKDRLRLPSVEAFARYERKKISTNQMEIKQWD